MHPVVDRDGSTRCHVSDASAKSHVDVEHDAALTSGKPSVPQQDPATSGEAAAKVHDCTVRLESIDTSVANESSPSLDKLSVGVTHKSTAREGDEDTNSTTTLHPIDRLVGATDVPATTRDVDRADNHDNADNDDDADNHDNADESGRSDSTSGAANAPSSSRLTVAKTLVIDAATMLLMRRSLITASDANLLNLEKRLLPAPNMPAYARCGRPLDKKELELESKSLKRKQASAKQRTSQSALHRARQALPVTAAKAEIMSIINNNPYSILVGGTGCGKSTQVPQLILESAIEADKGATCSIICTQPRRIAALSLAKRVAYERQEPVGERVGYHVRYEKVLPPSTGGIVYLTTGVLLRKLQEDPDRVLDGSSHIILDEVHERGVEIDLLMLSLRRLIATRIQLSQRVPKITLMSATLDIDLFANYWTFEGKPCPALTIPGKLFPVVESYLDDVLERPDPKIDTILDSLHPQFRAEVATARSYIKNEMKLTDASAAPEDNTPDVPIMLIAAMIMQICTTKSSGVILVFLPGLQEIQAVHQVLGSLTLPKHKLDARKLEILQLHSSLPKNEQSLIFAEPIAGRRRIILSTNIAETSITVPHVSHVVDSGVIRAPRYDATSKATNLDYVWQSKSSTAQKMGRAGRVQHGHYMALFSKARPALMPATSEPEILRTNLSALALDVKARFPDERLENLLSETIQVPDDESIKAAKADLQAMHALDQDDGLTVLGSVLARLPLPPHWGRVVLMGIMFRCLDPVLTIATSIGRDLFLRPVSMEANAKQRHQQYNVANSDHLALSQAYAELRRVDDSSRSAVAGLKFAQENFLSWNAYQDIKKDITAILRDLKACSLIGPKLASGMLPGGKPYNINNDNYELIKCLILSGHPGNLAAHCRGSAWRIGHRIGILSSSLCPKRPPPEERSKLNLQVFTVLRAAAHNLFYMGQISTVTALGALLFCDRLSIDARSGTLQINQLPEVRFEEGPEDAAKLVLEYKKLVDKTICNELQKLAAGSSHKVKSDAGSTSFTQRMIEILATAGRLNTHTALHFLSSLDASSRNTMEG